MSAVLDRFAMALVDPAEAVPAGVNGRRAIPDSRRFAVYRNNVHVSLVEALAKRYPVVLRLVGDEFFRGMARVYVGAHKPASPLLIHYGADFPDFIAAFGPAAAIPYLADVARLESAWLEAYHAADASPLEIAALLALPPERLPELRLVPHPATRLIVSPFPVGSIWSAHRSDPVQPIGHKGAELVLVVRPIADVGVNVLPSGDAGFIAALLAGQSVAEAAGAAGPETAPAQVLAGLIGLGAFAAIKEGTA
jgi:hypothetical protein